MLKQKTTLLEGQAEKLWWVRFVYIRELHKDAALPPRQENAFFYARDEAALQRQIAGWQHYIQHHRVLVQSIEQVPLGFNLHFHGLLPELPASESSSLAVAPDASGVS